MTVAFPPRDWDQESYCCVEGCANPATHRNLYSVAPDVDGDPAPVYEMVCCKHAVSKEPR